MRCNLFLVEKGVCNFQSDVFIEEGENPNGRTHTWGSGDSGQGGVETLAKEGREGRRQEC